MKHRSEDNYREYATRLRRQSEIAARMGGDGESVARSRRGRIRFAASAFHGQGRTSGMADAFFTKRRCDRCGGPLDGGRVMSMYNLDTICMSCKDAEKLRPDYGAAVEAERAAVAAGDGDVFGSAKESGFLHFSFLTPEFWLLQVLVEDLSLCDNHGSTLYAREQIDRKNYAAEMAAEGVTDILKLGLADTRFSYSNATLRHTTRSV